MLSIIGNFEYVTDITPSVFLFSPPAIPSLLQMSASVTPGSSPFIHFKDALRQRVDGRTPSLDRILGDIEAKAQEIGENLNVMHEDGLESRCGSNYTLRKLAWSNFHLAIYKRKS